MARKTLIHKHTNQTTTSGGVLSPKLPTAGTLEKGEIAVNYKNGYETLSIENDAGEVIPFASLEQTMAYTDASIVNADWNATSGKAQILNKPDIPDEKLSSSYQTSTLENDNLLLAGGDTYETAFSKIEKAILDNEETVAGALNDLNERLLDIDVPSSVSDLTDDVGIVKSITLNSNTYTPTNGVVDLGTITGTGTGEANVIESVKVNGTALTVTNKAVDITAVPASIVTADSTHRFVTDSEKTTWNAGQANVIETIKVNNTALTPDANKAVNIPLVSASANGLMSIADKEKLDSVKTWATKDVEFASSGRYDSLTFYSPVFAEYDNNIALFTDGTVPVLINVIHSAAGEQSGDVNWGHAGDNALGTIGFIRPHIEAKQDTLVSGTNIKTINNASILGSGNITIKANVQSDWNATTGDAVILNKPTIPAEVTESTVAGWGFTKNTGTVTGVKMNGTTNNTINGVVDLGTVLTSFTETDPTVPAWAKASTKPTYTASEVGALPDTYVVPVTSVNGQTGAVNLTIPSAPGTLNTTATTAQSTSSSEALSGNITLHKVAKTGTYSDLIGTPSAVTESTVSGWGFTKNAGTITGITMNGSSKGTSGVVNLGTVLTSHQNIKTINNNSLVGTGNVSIDTLPTVTSSDNGKILQVVNGAWALVTPVTVYTGTSTPNSSQGNNGDLYVQTS